MALEYRKEFGLVLRARRDELGLTQPQVAERVGEWLVEHGKREPGNPFNVQNISRWERGANLGNVDNQEAIAHALDTSLAELVARITPDGKPKRSTPDLAATFNGTVPDELREQLDRIEKRLGAVEKGQAKVLRLLGTATADHDLIKETHRAVAELLEQPDESGPPEGEGGTRREAG